LIYWLLKWVFDFRRDSGAKASLPMHSFIRAKAAEQERVSGSRLVSEFREIVREPLPDPSDPRFKKWKGLERFPWGWGVAQHQLLERLGRKPSDSDALWKRPDS
jgi:hypothetical protein